MRRLLQLKGLMLAAVALFGVIAATAQEVQAEKRFDLNIVEGDLQTATALLNSSAGVNLQFVFKPSTQPYSSITLRLVGVTVDEAMKYICEAAGAAYRKDPSGVFVIWHKGQEPDTPVGVNNNNTEVPVAKEPTIIKKIIVRHGSPRDILELMYARESDRLGEWKALMKFRQMHAADVIGKGSNSPVVLGTNGAFSPNDVSALGNSGNFNNNSAAPAGGDGSNGIMVPGGANQNRPGGGGFQGVGGGGGGFQGGGGFGQGGGGFGQGGGGFGQGGFGGGGFGQGGGGQVTLTGGQGFVPDGIDRVIYDPTDNSFIVEGTDSAVAAFERLVRQFDVVPKQVIVKVEFVTTTNSLSRNFGIDWLFQRGQVFIGNTPGTQARAGDPFFVNWASGNFSTRLRTSLLEGNGTVVNAPLIRTLNNQPAFVLQQINTFIIINNLVSTGNGQVIVAPQLTNIQIQSGLSVQPRINDDGFITMTISPQISEFGENRRGPNGEEIPDVISQQIFVTARVRDGETIVLGGLNRKRDTFTTQRYPILSDLPIIGGLFKSTSKGVDNQELLILITPTVVKDGSDGLGGP